MNLPVTVTLFVLMSGLAQSEEITGDDDGDGAQAVQVSTAEGMRTDVRNCLRPFKETHNDIRMDTLPFLSSNGTSNAFSQLLLPH